MCFVWLCLLCTLYSNCCYEKWYKLLGIQQHFMVQTLQQLLMFGTNFLAFGIFRKFFIYKKCKWFTNFCCFYCRLQIPSNRGLWAKSWKNHDFAKCPLYFWMPSNMLIAKFYAYCYCRVLCLLLSKIPSKDSLRKYLYILEFPARRKNAE